LDLLGVTEMSVDVSVGEVKLWGIPPDNPGLVPFFKAWIFKITNFYHYDLMPPSQISAQATQ